MQSMQSLGMSQESDSEAQRRASLYEALESVGLLEVYLDYIGEGMGTSLILH